MVSINEESVKVFVGCSPQDSTYLTESSLLGFLRGLEREGVELWTDQRVAAGDRWDEEVRERIKGSDIALVLVSQAFLDCEYCTNREIRRFFEESRQGGLVVFPFILSPCEWELHEWIRSRQFLPGTGETLEEHYIDPGSRKRLYLDLRQHLRWQVERQRKKKCAAPEVRPGRNAAEPRLAGERRQITVMYCELGSALGNVPLDPEELCETVPAFRKLATRVIERLGGRIEARGALDNGLTAHFGYPQAHRDDARRAVEAALEIVQEIQAKRHCESGWSTPLTVRAGIQTGPAVVLRETHEGHQLFLGEIPNQVAAIQAQAGPDEVLVGPITHRLIESSYHCEALGHRSLPGIPPEMPLHRVVDPTDKNQVWTNGSGWLVPSIGRDLELEILLGRWELVREGGGQAVVIGGEAGIGKSRLVQAFKARLVAEPRMIVECHCSPHEQNTAFYPISDFLDRMLAEPAPSRSARAGELPARVIERLAGLLEAPETMRELPLSLLPEGQEQKVRESLLGLFLELALHRPVVFVVEDVHWIDPSTLELLSHLVREIPAAPILVLLTHRPHFKPPWPHHSHLAYLTMSRLTRPQAEKLISFVAQDQALPAEVREEILARADGIPLFVEELTRLVLESPPHSARHGLPTIPLKLRDGLMARLDQLGSAKQVAQLAAALGPEFTLCQLQAISEIDADVLERELERLVEAEIFHRSFRAEHGSYTFKHALLCNLAHESLLKGERKEIHQRIATVFEERCPEVVEKRPELLAHHYSEAGLVARAVGFWRRAAENAVRAAANVEAVRYALRGLDMLEKMPQGAERSTHEMVLRIALGAALAAPKGYAAPEVRDAYARAHELCRQVEKGRRLFPALAGLAFFYLWRGALASALEMSRELLALAEEKRDFDFVPISHWLVGDALLLGGDLAGARLHLEEGIAFFATQRSLDLMAPPPGLAIAASLGNLSWALWFQGYPDQALECSRESVALSRHSPDRFTQALALFRASHLHVFRRELDQARVLAERLVELSNQHGLMYFVGAGMFLASFTRVLQDRSEEDLQILSETLDGLWSMGREMGWSRYLAFLAEACGAMGLVELGASLVWKALAAAEKEGERHYEAEIHRLRGELLEAAGAPWEEVEAAFLEALETARAQGARSLELRAVTGLVRFRRGRTGEVEARALLAEVYGTFDEGQDTADLAEARQHLAELAEKAA